MTRRISLVNWIIGALLIVTEALVIDRFVYQFTEVNQSVRDVLVSLAWLSPILIFSLIVLGIVLRCDDEKRLHRIGLFVILFSLLCRLAWITAFDAYQVNDFGFYLNCGADTAASGDPVASRFCGTEYWKRSVFYTYPIALLFGRSLFAVKLVNVLLATLTSWIFFRLGILLFGVRLAAAGLLFFIWQPDLWYSMTLASPDIPGLFWLAAFFYLCAILQRRLDCAGSPLLPGWRLVLLSVFLGVNIFFLDFTRTYHYSAILALGCYVVLESSLLLLQSSGDKGDPDRRAPGEVPAVGRGRLIVMHAVIWLLLPVGTYLLLNTGFWRIWRIPQDFGGSSLLCEVTAMDVLGMNTYEEIKDWVLVQCPKLGPAERRAFALKKLLQDLTHSPEEVFRYLQRKNHNLGLADDYLEWSTYARPELWDTTASQVKRIDKKYYGEQKGAIAAAHSLLLLLILWRLWLYPRVPFRRQEWIILLFSGCLFGLLLFLLESQPRYAIFLIFVFSWMAAQAVEDLHRRLFGKPAGAHAPHQTRRLHYYVGGAAVIAVLAGTYWSAASAIRGTPLTLRDQSGFKPLTADQLPVELKSSPLIPPVFVKNDYRELLLAYPPDSVVGPGSILAVQRTFTVAEKGGHYLRFFISVSAATGEPFDLKRNWTDTELECLVAVNGAIVLRRKLNDLEDGNLYVSLSEKNGIVFTAHTTIQFIILNRSRIGIVSPDRAPVAALEYVDLQ